MRSSSAILPAEPQPATIPVTKPKALPFEPLTPNAETIEAMKAARRGELTTVASPDQLLASLNPGLQCHDGPGHVLGGSAATKPAGNHSLTRAGIPPAGGSRMLLST
jgi:hypothetical protein